MSAPDDDTLRAMLAARTPGEWRVSSYFADDPPEVWARREGESEMVACIDSPIDQKPGPAATANADLCAAAPALAAEVLRLRAEIERRDADDAELHLSEIERHQRMCAALDIPEEDRAYATNAEVEAAATDVVCERDALAAEVLRLRERVARADNNAAGYLADHAAALLDLAAATARAEKAEAERDALRAAVRDWVVADDAVSGAEPLDKLDALERRVAAGLRLHALAEGGR